MLLHLCKLLSSVGGGQPCMSQRQSLAHLMTTGTSSLVCPNLKHGYSLQNCTSSAVLDTSMQAGLRLLANTAVFPPALGLLFLMSTYSGAFNIARPSSPLYFDFSSDFRLRP